MDTAQRGVTQRRFEGLRVNPRDVFFFRLLRDKSGWRREAGGRRIYEFRDGGLSEIKLHCRRTPTALIAA